MTTKKVSKKKSNWGGARPGSGPKRKEESKLKKTVYLYVVREELERLGGEDKFKELCYNILK